MSLPQFFFLATGDPDNLGPVDASAALLAIRLVNEIMQNTIVEDGAFFLPSHISHRIAHQLNEFARSGGCVPEETHS